MKLNRLFAAISLALAFTLTLGAYQAHAAWDAEQGYDPSLGLARISYMTGDVLFYSPDTEEWAETSPNFALREEDSLWVGDDSKAEVRFSTGETVWLNYQSGLDMLHMKSDGNGDTYQLGLPYGEASFSVKNFDVLGSVFQVDTPSASVRAYGRALFRVSALDDGTTQVGVRDGSVEVESEYGVLTLRPGDLMEVYSNGRSRVMELPGADSWTDWVDARLDRYSRSYTSSRYLPDEMHSYSDEFEENGSWVSYPDYGHVWVPRVSVGWSPYSYGRWIYSGYDYVWLPYDPWYAPYHYGRWYWDVGFGWFWIPPAVSVTFWSPGYVGWCYGPDYVYWVPLGPAEIYYGHGYYGPRSVNVYIHKEVNITNVYVNSRVTNSVVVVDRNEFRSGNTKRVNIKEKDNPFRHKVSKTTVIGRAPVKEIKPDRSLRLPKPDRQISDRARPPKKVAERVKAVKERKVVTRSQGSAFKDKKPERMREVDDEKRKPIWKQQSEKTKTIERDKTTRQRPDSGVKDTQGRVRDKTERKAVDKGVKDASKPDNGGDVEGATRTNRWDKVKTKPETRTRKADKETEAVGGTPGQGRVPAAEAEPGSRKIYRETGSDRGSLQRDTTEKVKDSAKGAAGQKRVEPKVDDGKPTGREGTWGSRVTSDGKKPQPAVREGAGRGVGPATGKEAEQQPVDPKAKKRATKKDGTSDEATEYVP